MVSFERCLAQLFHCESEEVRSFLQKSTRPCGALVIHDEFDDFAVSSVKLDCLGILTTDVHDRASLRVQKMGTHGVTRNLGQYFRREFSKTEGNATVAGPDDEFDITPRVAGLLQKLNQQLVGILLHVDASWDE